MHISRIYTISCCSEFGWNGFSQGHCLPPLPIDESMGIMAMSLWCDIFFLKTETSNDLMRLSQYKYLFFPLSPFSHKQRIVKARKNPRVWCRLFPSVCCPSHRIPSLATEVDYLVSIDFQVSKYLSGNQYWLHDLATLKITLC